MRATEPILVFIVVAFAASCTSGSSSVPTGSRNVVTSSLHPVSITCRPMATSVQGVLENKTDEAWDVVVDKAYFNLYEPTTPLPLKFSVPAHESVSFALAYIADAFTSGKKDVRMGYSGRSKSGSFDSRPSNLGEDQVTFSYSGAGSGPLTLLAEKAPRPLGVRVTSFKLNGKETLARTLEFLIPVGGKAALPGVRLPGSRFKGLIRYETRLTPNVDWNATSMELGGL